jgi:peptidoglycan/xylan/chitin deacetylase (PgdA/CDA1 family)
MAQLTGATTKPWFRPPYGDTDASVQADAAAAGYHYEVMWTVDSLGWEGIPASQVIANVMSGVAPGAIILMHVGSGSTDCDALPTLIDRVQAAGYAFGTVAQVL